MKLPAEMSLHMLNICPLQFNCGGSECVVVTAWGRALEMSPAALEKDSHREIRGRHIDCIDF